MSFNTALSGIRAANADLSVTGNNIANAGTIGFKSSRAEFADVYSSSILGSGGYTAGSGVSLEMIRQNFDNGNRKITERDLDMAVNGTGFFVMNKDGDQLFTRAGSFSLDKDGYVISSPGTYLQGFSANAAGNIGGILGNLRIDVTTQAPRQTTLVTASYNLNSNAPVLETTGTQFSTAGEAIGRPNRGQSLAATTAATIGSTMPVAPVDFSISLTVGDGAAVPNPISISAGDLASINGLEGFVNLINSKNASSASPLDVWAILNEDGEIEIRDQISGRESRITITGDYSGDSDDTANGGTPGHPAAHNGYGSQTLVIAGPNGDSFTYTSDVAASAAQTASELNALAGISAVAKTEARLYIPDPASPPPPAAPNPNLTTLPNQITLNGVPLARPNGDPILDLQDLESRINELSTSSLAGITAEFASGELRVFSNVGADIKFSFAGGAASGNPVYVGGRVGSIPEQIQSGETVVIGGSIDILMEEGFSITNTEPDFHPDNIFLRHNIIDLTEVPINSFDPSNQDTYNHATSLPIYDSLGNPHVMTQYFVKQNYDPADTSTSPNHWVMYVQVDGENVGDPDPTLPPPANSVPTMASFNLHFSPDGTLNESISDRMLISNWRPRGADGEIIGALGPLNVLQGGTLPVVEPPTSSNFEIDLSGTTQFGNVFAVEDRDQNGYSTGRLSGLDVGADGIIFARFTNGEAQVLGQVALANFNNVDALKPVGNTMWAQTFETGEAIIGAPGSASLGAVASGSLEESNVDLSEQLVNLIIAQRNFQANAKTIETANATTQTIINLR